MTNEYKFTGEHLEELIGDDLSLPASLATLINEGGDIRTFLVKKLEEREEALDEYELSQQTEEERKWHEKADYMDTYYSYPLC